MTKATASTRTRPERAACPRHTSRPRQLPAPTRRQATHPLRPSAERSGPASAPQAGRLGPRHTPRRKAGASPICAGLPGLSLHSVACWCLSTRRRMYVVSCPSAVTGYCCARYLTQVSAYSCTASSGPRTLSRVPGGRLRDSLDRAFLDPSLPLWLEGTQRHFLHGRSGLVLGLRLSSSGKCPIAPARALHCLRCAVGGGLACPGVGLRKTSSPCGLHPPRLAKTTLQFQSPCLYRRPVSDVHRSLVPHHRPTVLCHASTSINLCSPCTVTFANFVVWHA